MPIRFARDLKKYASYSFYAARARLKSEISGSYLNWLWLVLEPFCFMLIYTFIVEVVYRTREPYFPVFVFIGLAVWSFFNKSVSQSVKAVRSNRSIITKTYVPKFVLVLVILLANAFKMLVSFCIAFVMLFFFNIQPTWNLLFFFPLVLLLFLGTFAVSMVMMHFGTFVDDLANVTAIVLRLVFYLSGIFYSVATRVPAPWGEILSRVNPIAFIINQARNIFLFGEGVSMDWYCIWLFVSVVLGLLSIALVYKYENKYAKVI